MTFKKVVPIVPEGGNTKTPSSTKINPAKRWCFTLNNYNEDEYCSICSTIKALCSKGIIGREIGESGTPHLQGYIEFKSKARPKSKFSVQKIHWEKCKGSREENIAYCSKSDKDAWTHGLEKPYTVEIPELYDWEKYVINILEDEPDDRSINWLWEEEGCAGKTTFCKYVFMHYERVVVLSGKASDMKNCILEYYNTNAYLPRVVLIDIPRSTNTDFLSYQGIEEIKNMFFYSGKYEGGMVCGRPPHMFVFANEAPNTMKCSQDRWKIKYIAD